MSEEELDKVAKLIRSRIEENFMRSFVVSEECQELLSEPNLPLLNVPSFYSVYEEFEIKPKGRVLDFSRWWFDPRRQVLYYPPWWKFWPRYFWWRLTGR